MPRHIDRKPAAGCCNFLVHGCLVEQRGKALTVTLFPGVRFRGATFDAEGRVAWTVPEVLAVKRVTITCAGSAARRHDAADYPPAPRFDGPRLVFRGGPGFGRVALASGSALLVQAQVRAVRGLPRGVRWDGFATVELLDPAAGAPPLRRRARALEAATGPGGGDDPSDGSSGPHLPFP